MKAGMLMLDNLKRRALCMVDKYENYSTGIKMSELYVIVMSIAIKQIRISPGETQGFQFLLIFVNFCLILSHLALLAFVRSH